jgi:hypothetical protein
MNQRWVGLAFCKPPGTITAIDFRRMRCFSGLTSLFQVIFAGCALANHSVEEVVSKKKFNLKQPPGKRNKVKSSPQISRMKRMVGGKNRSADEGEESPTPIKKTLDRRDG